MTQRRTTLLLIITTIALPVAYYAGGVDGFGKGYAAASYSRSGDAGATVAVLTRLRAGDTNVATDLLESQLDVLIVSNSVGRQAFGSAFNLPRLVGVGSAADIDKAAAPVIAYRAQIPTRGSTPAVVRDALNELAKRTKARQ